MTEFMGVDESLQDLFDHAPCGYLSITPDGLVTRVNETFLQLCGYSREEVLGEPFEALLTPGSQLFLQTRYLPTLQLTGEVGGVVVSLLRRNADPLPVLINSTLRRAPDGSPVVMRTAVFDATERENYERELLSARREAERSESRVRVLERASAALSAADTEQALAAALAESARTAFDATSAAVFLADEEGNLTPQAGALPLGLVIPPEGLGPEIEAMKLNSVVTVENAADADSRFPGIHTLLSEARVESLIAAPLFQGKTALGVLVCFFLRQRSFEPEAVELLATLSRQSAQVLQRVRLQGQLRHMALYDQLTGLANRKLLQSRLEQALATAVRHGRPMALLYLDLDGFKSINDDMGHPVGDEALRHVADRLKEAVRGSDTIARIGGDEFIIVCEDTDANAAAQVSRRVREAISGGPDGSSSPYRLTSSVGIALFSGTVANGDAPTAESLIKHADAAMYRSKREGKDRETTVVSPP